MLAIRPARYVQWLSNVVSVFKKNGKLRVYIDFRNLNAVTSKNEYSILITDLLVGLMGIEYYLPWMETRAITKYSYLKNDRQKTVFGCLSLIGTFEWIVMSFTLKNARATHQ